MERRYENEVAKADQLRRQAAKLKNIGINSGSDLLINKTKQLKDRAEKIESAARPAHKEQSAGAIRLANSGTHAKALIAINDAAIATPDGRPLFRTGQKWIEKGDRIVLLGRNGAGRTTTVKSILGLVGRRTGSVMIDKQETIDWPTHEIAKLGLGYCPEERGIFSALTCEENLMLPPVIAPGGMTVDEIYEMFPNLYERRSSPGTRLSGGEQQMLAVGRILRTGAKCLLLDEISEGLAPVIVQALAKMITALKAKGFTIIMVEQNFRFAAPLADRFYVMEHGQIVEGFSSQELTSKMGMLHEYLGV
jgi:branched-chain amino acid transport system ATP-binding protein